MIEENLANNLQLENERLKEIANQYLHKSSLTRFLLKIRDNQTKQKTTRGSKSKQKPRARNQNTSKQWIPNQPCQIAESTTQKKLRFHPIPRPSPSHNIRKPKPCSRQFGQTLRTRRITKNETRKPKSAESFK